MELAPWQFSLHGTPLPLALPCSQSRPRACLQNPHMRARCLLWGNRAESKGLGAVRPARLVPVGGVSGAGRSPGPAACQGPVKGPLPLCSPAKVLQLKVPLLCSLQKKNLSSSLCSEYLPQCGLKPVPWGSSCPRG